MNVGFMTFCISGIENFGVHKGRTVYDYNYFINGVNVNLCSLTNIHHPSRNGELKEEDVSYISIDTYFAYGKDAFYLLKSFFKANGLLE